MNYLRPIANRPGIGTEAPTEKFGKELWDDFFSKKENLKSYERYRAFVIESYDVVKKFTAFLGEKAIDDFERYVKETSPLYLPDFVAKKNKKIYIVEVKTNAGIRQIRGLKEGSVIAKKYGFAPILITLKVNIEASDLVIETLTA